MFRAISRFFRAILYFMTGKVDQQTDKIQQDPTVIKATFARIVQEKKGKIQEYMSAVATIVGQKEKKSMMVKRLTEEVNRLRKLQAGAGGKARERATELKVKETPIAQIKVDAIIMQAKAAFSDFGSTLVEKEARIAELESDCAGYADRIKTHKIQLQSLQRDIDKLKDEASDTVADVITAREEKELNDVLSDIAEDGTGAELERMRDLRTKAKAEAKVASELAGTDSRQMENEYEQFASANQANDEFDDLLGLDKSDDEKMQAMESKLDRSKAAPVSE